MVRPVVTDEQIQQALSLHGSIPKAAQQLGVKYDTLQKRINRMRRTGKVTTDDRKRVTRRFVVTSAQDSTAYHEPFFQALQHYCDHVNAQLVVIPVNYENITLTSKNGKQDKWWPAPLVRYLCHHRIEVNDNLLIMGDVSVNATNVNPLTGLQTITGKKSGLFGHGQLEMRVIPTPLSKLPKKLQTTGSISVPNYSATKAGKIAEDNHCIGAVAVETFGDRFWVRQLRAEDNGTFYDLNLKCTSKGVEHSSHTLGLVCGDVHWDFICPKVLKATFTAQNSIVNTLHPQKVVIHDIFDGYSGSHHHRKDPLLQYHKHVHGTNNVERELSRLIDGIRIMARQPLVVVDSNHNRHFSRWLNECNPAQDHENAELYYEVRLAQVRQAKEVDNPRALMDPLEWYIRQKIKDIEIEFIGHDSGHALGRYDITNHGDIGANGTRGSAQQFTRFGGYYILGHSHTPGVYKNVLQTGTSTILDMPYVGGPSSWLNSHVLVYPNGMGTHIDIIEGRWRA